MHSAIRDQNQQQQQPKPTNNKKKKRIRKKGKKKKENHNQIRILYANVNGARGKITSLQAAADSQKPYNSNSRNKRKPTRTRRIRSMVP